MSGPKVDKQIQASGPFPDDSLQEDECGRDLIPRFQMWAKEHMNKLKHVFSPPQIIPQARQPSDASPATLHIVSKKLSLHRSKSYSSVSHHFFSLPIFHSQSKKMGLLTWVKVLISGHTLGIRLFWRFRVFRPGSFSNVEGIFVIFFPFRVMILVFLPPFSAPINNLSAMILEGNLRD